MHPLIRHITSRLSPFYSGDEATEMAWWLMEELSGVSRSQLLVDGLPDMTGNSRLDEVIIRLRQNEPIQYIFGHTYWMGLRINVSPATLIPRPETAELVEHIVRRMGSLPIRKVLDVGTGSGCIALALAQRFSHWQVEGMDISEEALKTARQNADENRVNVRFFAGDILSSTRSHSYDLVVSNPPYICRREAVDMRHNVLDWEPDSALFVPDDNPLLFYRAIAHAHMAPYLAMEINAQMGDALIELMHHEDYQAEVVVDSFGKPRFLFAW